MELVTGRKGEVHVTSQQDRMLNQGIFGDGAYILNTGQNLEPQVQSSNEIRIRDGAIMVQGALGCVKVNTYDSVTIQNGSQGMKRIDLICWQYTYDAEQDVESAEWVVIQGTPAESDPQQPSYTDGSIQEGDPLVQVPVFAVNLDGINVTGVDVLLKTVADNEWTEFLPVRNPSSKITIDNSRPWGFYYNPGLKLLIMTGGFVTKQSITTDDILGYLPVGIPLPDSDRFINVGFMGYTTSGGVEFASPRALAIGQSAGAILFRSAAQAGVTYISEFTYVWDY